MSKVIIYLDVDEVLKDFQGSALKASGVDTTNPKVIKALLTADWPTIESLAGGREGFCRPVTEGGAEFWQNIETLPWAHELIKALKEIPNTEIIAVSSPSQWIVAAQTKIEQITNEFGLDYCICKAKYKLAGPNKILIDDSIHNCEKFVEYGGRVFLWPTKTQLIYGDLHDPISAIDAAVVAVYKLLSELP